MIYMANVRSVFILPNPSVNLFSRSLSEEPVRDPDLLLE